MHAVGARAARALLVVLSLSGCAGGHRSTSAASASSDASTAFAPTPYSAEQIRDASKPGRVYRFRREEAGKATVVRVLTFAKMDETGVDVVASVEDEHGKILASMPPERAKWEELRKHAEFPRAQVVIHDETVTVPAGTFACAVYTVTDPATGEVSRFAFAKTLPGPPVEYWTDKNGARVMTSTLLEHRPGGAATQ